MLLERLDAINIRPARGANQFDEERRGDVGQTRHETIATHQEAGAHDAFMPLQDAEVRTDMLNADECIKRLDIAC